MKVATDGQLQMQRNGASPDERVVAAVINLLREGYDGCPECPGCLTDVAVRAAREWEREVVEGWPRRSS